MINIDWLFYGIYDWWNIRCRDNVFDGCNKGW